MPARHRAASTSTAASRCSSRSGYDGPLSVEHEPYDRDPTSECVADARAARGATRATDGRRRCANGALRVAVVGCGNISGPYGETLQAYPTIEIAGATDVDRGLSAEFVERFGGIDYPVARRRSSPTAQSTRSSTSPRTASTPRSRPPRSRRASTSTARSRSPRATREARSLVELADAHGVRLSCSPITFMGEAQEAAWRLLAAGAIGTVRVAYAEVNWGRIETWHPRPAPFYGIGPLADVGVYPLTILTAMFGPARRVTAFGRVVLPDRMTTGGRAVHRRRPGLRRRRDRARGRADRPADDELLRDAAREAARDRVPRRRRLAPPLELAGLRRSPRARARR